MKRTMQRALCAFLLACLLLSPVQATALDSTQLRQTLHKTFYNETDNLLDRLLNGIANVYPTPRSWKPLAQTALPGFLRGTAQRLATPAPGARFSLGYDNRSLLNGAGIIVGKQFVGGSIAFKKKVATEIVDDLKVRTVALSDGSGRGTAVLLVLDAYGFSLPDTRALRTRLASFLQAQNIVSLTVSVLHQHSAVDTFGMNGDIWRMALGNPWSRLFGAKTVNGKDADYMTHLFAQCEASVKAAVAQMTPGALYYGTADQTAFLLDKRAPFVCDPNFNRYRFVPDDGSRETWLVSSEIHCVGNGAAGTAITGDYPYYAEQVINDEADANVLFYLGAEQSTSQQHNETTVEDYHPLDSRLKTLAGFGRAIGHHLMKISQETEVAPLLNVRMQEVVLPITNPVLKLAGKAGIFDTCVVKNGDALCVLTEIGLLELGTDAALALVPGELAAELAYGGCLQADEAWSGEDWLYPSMQELLAQSSINRTLRVLGLANDQLGYIVPDNNFMPMLAPESSSIELVSLGKATASCLLEAFTALFAAE